MTEVNTSRQGCWTGIEAGMTPTTFVTLPIQKHASSAWSQEGVKIKQKQKLKTFLEGTCLTLWSSTWDALPKESKRRLPALNIFVLPQFHPRLNSNALFIFARERIKLHWFPFFFPQTPGHQGKELRVENVNNLGKGAVHYPDNFGSRMLYYAWGRFSATYSPIVIAFVYFKGNGDQHIYQPHWYESHSIKT